MTNTTNLDQLLEEKCEARVQMMQWKLARGMWRASSYSITEERAKLYDTINQHIEHLIERLDCEIKDEIEGMYEQEEHGKLVRLYSDELQLLRDKISNKRSKCDD